MEPTDKERLAVLEEKTRVIDETQKEIVAKLDQLLGLKHKGVGAFWVMSAITGTGIIGVVYSFIDWLKGVSHG